MWPPSSSRRRWPWAVWPTSTSSWPSRRGGPGVGGTKKAGSRHPFCLSIYAPDAEGRPNRYKPTEEEQRHGRVDSKGVLLNQLLPILLLYSRWQKEEGMAGVTASSRSERPREVVRCFWVVDGQLSLPRRWSRTKSSRSWSTRWRNRTAPWGRQAGKLQETTGQILKNWPSFFMVLRPLWGP